MKLPTSLFTRLAEEQRPDEDAPLAEATPIEDLDTGGGWQLELRRRRRAALMKRMLTDSGYGDLAKMVSIKER